MVGGTTRRPFASHGVGGGNGNGNGKYMANLATFQSFESWAKTAPDWVLWENCQNSEIIRLGPLFLQYLSYYAFAPILS